MKRLALISLVILTLLSYQPDILATCEGFNNPATPFAKETLTVSSTALPFSSTVYNPATAIAPARIAYVTVETDTIRWWKDGSTPTNLLGHLQAVNSNFEVCGNTAITQFRMIRVTGDSTVHITYSR